MLVRLPASAVADFHGSVFIDTRGQQMTPVWPVHVGEFNRMSEKPQARLRVCRQAEALM